MRGAFGLISLLIGVALLAYVWSMHTSAVSTSSKQATDQVRQLSGRDENGESALKSIDLQGENVGGQLKDLLVTSVTPGGAMEKFYGFKKGDKIISEGSYEIGINNDADTASKMLLHVYEASQPVEVIRDGHQLTLPVSSPSGQPISTGKSLQDQVNQLQQKPLEP